MELIGQEKSLPLWRRFKSWLEQIKQEGVTHNAIRNAIDYLLNNWEALTRYCKDGRLPISNIQSERVAKIIALAPKNFLFADTPVGAKSSAMIYSILETALCRIRNKPARLTV